MKWLNLAGGVSLAAIAIGGYLVITEPYNEVALAEDPIAELNVAKEQNVGTPVSDNQETKDLKDDNTRSEEESIQPKKSVKYFQPKSDLAEELQSFDASCNNGSLIFNWVTEGGTKYPFEIEKSYDKQSYEVFIRAPQPEKKDGKNFYSVEEMVSEDEVAFYRLKRIIGKGKYEYSEMVQVKCTKKASGQTEVDVFPNGYGSFRIVINTKVQDTFNVSLFDLNNKELVAGQYEAMPGSNEFQLSSDSISRGNYLLRVTNGSMIKEKKVVLK